MRQGELDASWPIWPYRASIRPRTLDEAIMLARWCRDHLGDPGDDRHRILVCSLEPGGHPWPQGQEILIYTRDPVDHAMILLTWC